LAAAGAPSLAEPTIDGAEAADVLKAEADALDALALRGYANEHLDQLLVEVLLGVR
jgi:xylose isomerase